MDPGVVLLTRGRRIRDAIDLINELHLQPLFPPQLAFKLNHGKASVHKRVLSEDLINYLVRPLLV